MDGLQVYNGKSIKIDDLETTINVDHISHYDPIIIPLSHYTPITVPS